MAKVTVTINVSGATVADLVKQVVLDDELNSPGDPPIASENVKPEHVLDMFMQTCVFGSGSVGLYSAYVIDQKFEEDE